MIAFYLGSVLGVVFGWTLAYVIMDAKRFDRPHDHDARCHRCREMVERALRSTDPPGYRVPIPGGEPRR